MLERLKRQHPRLDLIITEGGVPSNAPHTGDLQELGYGFILGAKPGDYADLFEQVLQAGEESKYHCFSTAHAKGKTETSWVKALPLNKSYEDIRVHYIAQVDLTQQGETQSRFG